MSFHTIGFFESITNVADVDIQPLVDDIVQIQNNHFIFPRDVFLWFAWLGSVTLNRGRLNSPSIRQIAPRFVRPVELALLPPQDPNVEWLGDRPFRVRGQEEFILEVTGANAMAENFHSVMGLMERFEPAPQGDPYILRGTGTTTAVANVWTTATITWDTALPVGRYAVIGCELFSATGIGFRLIFDDQVWRPGGLSQATLGLRSFKQQLDGALGVWGVFNTISLPRVQVFCNAADTVQTVFMKVVRVG